MVGDTQVPGTMALTITNIYHYDCGYGLTAGSIRWKRTGAQLIRISTSVCWLRQITVERVRMGTLISRKTNEEAAY